MPSTQDEVHRLLRGSPKPLPYSGVAALHQTAGRGRFKDGKQHHWHDRPGENALFSFYLEPENLPARSAHLLTQTAAVATVQSLETEGIRASVKWPNDVVLDGKKLAGILTETRIRNGRVFQAIVGIGLNVNQMAFPPEIDAVSVARITGRNTDPLDWAHRIKDRFRRLWQETEPDRLAGLFVGYWQRYGPPEQIETAGGRIYRSFGIEKADAQGLHIAHGEKITYIPWSQIKQAL